jgi:heat shock protein HslJ
MQQPQLTTYAEIAEVRTVTGAAACNQLLAEGWVLLGVFPVTRIG